MDNGSHLDEQSKIFDEELSDLSQQVVNIATAKILEKKKEQEQKKAREAEKKKYSFFCSLKNLFGNFSKK